MHRADRTALLLRGLSWALFWPTAVLDIGHTHSRTRSLDQPNPHHVPAPRSTHQADSGRVPPAAVGLHRLRWPQRACAAQVGGEEQKGMLG